MLKRMLMLLAIGSFSSGSVSAQTANVSSSKSVELRISATGQSVKAADYVLIYVPISTNADTASAARAANSAAITALTNALVAHGIDRNAITLMSASASLPMALIGNEAYDPGDTLQVPSAMKAMMPRKTALSTVRIRLSNVALFDNGREVFDQQNQAMTGAPLYSLNDDRAAKNEAIADAITKAKQDADAYGAPLGLRVDRITSISNYGDATPVVPDVNFFAQIMAGAQGGSTKSVTTKAQVWVNFVLVPR